MKRASINYGSNRAEVTLGDLTVWFSYSTPIAFMNGGGLVISENCWGPTTGRHLNAVDAGKNKRLPRAEFERRLEEVLP